MTDLKKKKPMTASDYIQHQPHLQGKPLTTQNTFSALAEFPPLSYANAVGPAKTQTSLQASSSTQNPVKTSYFVKPQKQHLLTTNYTKPITLKELSIFTNRVFYADGLYPTDNVLKNRTFYEYILVDSGSAEITHYQDKNNPNMIAYSTCKILRIHSAQDLGFIHSQTAKPFSNPGFHIQGYTYVDYINAFFKTFYLRAYDHSWFISFERNCNKNLPGWFFEWWYYLGATNDIYPADLIKSSYPYYLKNITQQPVGPTNIISFHIDMGIPWIFSWHFNVALHLPGMPYSLLREFRIKWWDKFNLERCSLANIQKLFQITQQMTTAVRSISRATPLLKSNQASLSTPTKSLPAQKVVSPTQSSTSSKSATRRSARQAKLQKLIATISQQMESSSDEEDLDSDIQSMEALLSDDPIGGQDPFEM